MNTSKLKTFAQNARRRLMEQVAVRVEAALNMDGAEAAENRRAIEELRKAIYETSKEAVVERVQPWTRPLRNRPEVCGEIRHLRFRFVEDPLGLGHVHGAKSYFVARQPARESGHVRRDHGRDALPAQARRPDGQAVGRGRRARQPEPPRPRVAGGSSPSAVQTTASGARNRGESNARIRRRVTLRPSSIPAASEQPALASGMTSQESRTMRRHPVSWTIFTMSVRLEANMPALIPEKDQAINATFRYNRLGGRDGYQTDFVSRDAVAVPAGGNAQSVNRLFAGAKQVELLDKYEEQADKKKERDKRMNRY